MREEVRNSKEKQHKPDSSRQISRVYIVSYNNEYYMIFDPAHEDGYIHIYKQIESVPVSMLKEKFKEAWNREALIYFFIKKRFVKEPDIVYELCLK